MSALLLKVFSQSYNLSSVNSAEPVRNYLFLIQFCKTLLLLIHDHLVDFKQEYGFQWRIVPVEECRVFVAQSAFTRLLIVMHKHKCRRLDI